MPAAYANFAASYTLATAREVWRLIWLRLVALLLLSTWAAGCASLPTDVPRPTSQAIAVPEQTALGRLTQARREQARASAESGFYLLDSVDTAFGSRLALVDAAQRSLDLQYYAIHADASTEVLLQRIRNAARRGVRVRILLDDFNTVGDDAQVLRMAFEPGVELRLFNPIAGPRGSLATRLLGSLGQIGRIQKRMHNKLFIADNAWGIAGGRNLGDVYFGGDGKSAFVDLDVLATGAIVRAMSASFDRYWNDELAYPASALLSRRDLERLREASIRADAQNAGEPGRGTVPAAAAVLQAQRGPTNLAQLPLRWAPATLLVDKPGKLEPGDDEVAAGDTVIDGLLGLMNQAKEEVLIVSPYFVPGAQMMQTFAQLRERGVRVRVLTNSLASNDAPAAHAGYARYRPRLLALGVELHEMRADIASAVGLADSRASRGASGFGLGSGASAGSGSGVASIGSAGSVGEGPGGSKSGGARARASLHSKAVIIDRRLSVIGSMNLDLRSKLQNSEVALLVRSTALAQQAASLIDASFARSAYRVLPREGGGLVWRAPPGVAFADTTHEPDADFKLRLLVTLLGPLAPEEML